MLDHLTHGECGGSPENFREAQQDQPETSEINQRFGTPRGRDGHSIVKEKNKRSLIRRLVYCSGTIDLI